MKNPVCQLTGHKFGGSTMRLPYIYRDCQRCGHRDVQDIRDAKLA